MTVVPIGLLAAYILLLLLAALQDLRALRISNILSVSVLVAAIALLALVVKPAAPWEHLVSFLALLAVGAFLFTKEWFGGGDVKLAAAAAALFNLSQLLWFVIATTLIGGLITLLLLFGRTMLPRDTKISWLGLQRGRAVPYGVAVAAGAILVALSVVPLEPETPAFPVLKPIPARP